MRSLRSELHWSRKILLVPLVFLHAHGVFASGDTQCTESLLRASAPAARLPLISSLAPAEQHGSVDKAIRDLAGLRLRLDLAKVGGSRALELTALEADFEKKERELAQYLERQQIMTRDELRERMKRDIVQLQNQRQVEQSGNDRVREDEERRRREQEERIQNIVDGTRAVFHRIEPGSFKMGEVGKQVDVTLTRPFEMMATQVTQVIWQAVAELANSRLGDKYKINVDPSKFKGDTHPVEQVSYDEDVQPWLDALNELSQAGEPSLAKVIPSHKPGDIYRLPTEAEWEFVIRGRGRYNGTYHFGDEESQLDDYAWFFGSSTQTHPVAQKIPLVIDGRDFYDMHGNVWEWVHDWHQDDLPGGVDPEGEHTSFNRVVRGGSWGNKASLLCSGSRIKCKPAFYNNSSVGFRLARTVK